MIALPSLLLLFFFNNILIHLTIELLCKEIFTNFFFFTLSSCGLISCDFSPDSLIQWTRLRSNLMNFSNLIQSKFRFLDNNFTLSISHSLSFTLWKSSSFLSPLRFRRCRRTTENKRLYIYFFHSLHFIRFFRGFQVVEKCKISFGLSLDIKTIALARGNFEMK